MSDIEKSRVSFRAPELVQGSDQSALLTIADVLSPGLVVKNESEGGLMLTVAGTWGTTLHYMSDRLVLALLSLSAYSEP
jgi:hypothetical protein